MNKVINYGNYEQTPKTASYEVYRDVGMESAKSIYYNKSVIGLVTQEMIFHALCDKYKDKSGQFLPFSEIYDVEKCEFRKLDDEAEILTPYDRFFETNEDKMKLVRQLKTAEILLKTEFDSAFLRYLIGFYKRINAFSTLDDMSRINMLLEQLEYSFDKEYFAITKNVNVKAVQNSVRNIFTWIPGERILNPEFGCDLRKYLYEGILDFNIEQIIAEVKHCFTAWEPRAQLVRIENVGGVSAAENNEVHLEIVYTIPTLSDEEFRYSYYYIATD